MSSSDPHTSLIVSIARRLCTDDGACETAIPRLTLHQSLTPTEPVPAFYQRSFCAIVQGTKTVRVGDREWVYGAGEHLVAGFDVPVIGTVTLACELRPYVCVQLTFDRDLVLEVTSGLPGYASLASVAIARTCGDLLSAMSRFVGLLERAHEAPHLAPLYEREILYRLLTGPHGDALRHFALADVRTASVDRAINYLRESFGESFCLQRLLDVAGRSQSSLYRDFKDATGMSPLQYRRRLRLQEVRRLMLVEKMGAAEAGHAVGYESPSHLTREYKQLYGYPPAEDISRMRRAGSTQLVSG